MPPPYPTRASLHRARTSQPDTAIPAPHEDPLHTPPRARAALPFQAEARQPHELASATGPTESQHATGRRYPTRDSVHREPMNRADILPHTWTPAPHVDPLHIPAETRATLPTRAEMRRLRESTPVLVSTDSLDTTTRQDPTRASLHHASASVPDTPAPAPHVDPLHTPAETRATLPTRAEVRRLRESTPASTPTESAHTATTRARPGPPSHSRASRGLSDKRCVGPA